MTSAPPAGSEVSLRPLTEADLALSEGLYVALRWDEFRGTGLDAAQKRALLVQQHRAQRAHWRRGRPQARWLLIELAGEPAGRIIVDEEANRTHVLDLFVVPAASGQGVGRAALLAVLAESKASGRNVSLNVRRGNDRARALYERLGFTVMDEGQLDSVMERAAESQ